MKFVSSLAFVLFYYLVSLITAPNSDQFKISFLDVDQGDAALINIPQYGRVMVDTGPDSQASYSAFDTGRFPKCLIKSVFITHYDKDHSGGLARLERFCPDIQVYDNLSAGDSLNLGQTTFYVLSPPSKDSPHQENKDSLVILIKYQDFEVLLTGDAELSSLEAAVPRINELLGAGNLDVFKVSHHGSKYNSSAKLVNSLKPAYCVVSVGENSYGHPSRAVLAELEDAGCRVYRTDVDGNVSF